MIRALAAVVCGLALLTGCSSAPTTAAGVDPLAVVTGSVGAPVPSEAPAQERLDPVPSAGTVALRPGPFDDRLRLDGLALAGGVVTGEVSVVSDVSELLALEVRVDFYDATGLLVGTDRQVVDPEEAEEFHSDSGIADLPLALTGPSDAASAVLSVPVLVNE